MKLYATVTSERATKGQGGNRDVVVDLFVGSAKESRHIVRLVLATEGNEYSLSYTDREKNEDMLILKYGEIKSNNKDEITKRLEYLRGEIKAERISYGEIAELQGLAKHIESGDVELLEWAGVKEGAKGKRQKGELPAQCEDCKKAGWKACCNLNESWHK